jgi:hypothetical protein
MTGSIFISAKKGWACSNEMLWVVDREIIEREGQKVSKHTDIFKIKALFLHGIELSKNLFVDLIVKLDDNDKIQGFTGVVIGQTNETLAIMKLTTTERTEEILNKIKEEN